MTDDLDILINCTRRMIGNSTDYPLSALCRAKEACDKNNLSALSKKLELKIKKAEVLRKSSKKDLAKLLEEGLKVGLKVYCKKCLHRKCRTIVLELSPVDLKEGFVKVRCKDETPGEPVTVSADKIKLVGLGNN